MADSQVCLPQAILSCRCPRCGRGKLFKGLLSVPSSCPSCGLDLQQSDTGDAGAVIVIMLLGAIVAGLAIWTEFRFSPPIWVHIVLWPVVTFPAAILMMRLAKSTLVGLQYRHRSSEMGW